MRYARTLDDYGFNYTLVPYGSGSYDPFTIGATIAAVTKNISVIIALRPNTMYPTVAAKALATLDQLSAGRVVVHFIAGGGDAEQAKEGDFLEKDERYGRLEDYIKILRRAWASPEPFDWESKYYTFKGFSNQVRPTKGHIPVSVGGSSAEAYRIGGSLADIFGLWGEPLKETKEQIDRIYAEADKAGRTDRPRIWVTFRPILAETDDLAWQKAYRYLDLLKANQGKTGPNLAPQTGSAPQNVGSQRLLDIASRGEVQDRALWYPTVSLITPVFPCIRYIVDGPSLTHIIRSPRPAPVAPRRPWWDRRRRCRTRSSTTSTSAASSSRSAATTTTTTPLTTAATSCPRCAASWRSGRRARATAPPSPQQRPRSPTSWSRPRAVRGGIGVFYESTSSALSVRKYSEFQCRGVM